MADTDNNEKQPWDDGEWKASHPQFHDSTDVVKEVKGFLVSMLNDGDDDISSLYGCLFLIAGFVSLFPLLSFGPLILYAFSTQLSFLGDKVFSIMSVILDMRLSSLLLIWIIVTIESKCDDNKKKRIITYAVAFTLGMTMLWSYIYFPQKVIGRKSCQFFQRNYKGDMWHVIDVDMAEWILCVKAFSTHDVEPLRQLMRHEHDKADYYALVHALAFAQGHHANDPLVTYFQALLRDINDDSDGYFNLLEQCRDSIATTTDSAAIAHCLHSLALRYHEQGKTEQGLECMETLTSMFPDSVNFAITKASILQQSRARQAAAEQGPAVSPADAK